MAKRLLSLLLVGMFILPSIAQRATVNVSSGNGSTVPVRSTSGSNDVTQAQGIQTPGLDVLGYGYDVFGMYADQKSKKRYCLFRYDNYTDIPIGSYFYKVPRYVFLENISKHNTKTVSGESIRDYSRSLSVQAGLNVETMFFKGAISSSYDMNESKTEQKFYFTYMDANVKWRVSFDERSMANLKDILDPQFKKDLETMSPQDLFRFYGTHYIASAYLGGRADYVTETTITGSTKTQDIAVAVEASYKAVSGNASTSVSTSQSARNSQTKSELTVVGGNSQYANNIQDPETYRLWADGIESMPVLCDFDNNSLKPIWDFCETPSRRALLQAAFDELCAKNPLPEAFVNLRAVADKSYMIKNKAFSRYFDFAGFHTNAENKPGAKLQIAPKDGNSHKGQGFDRVYRILPNEMEPEWVAICPQHADLVLDIAGGSFQPGAPLQMWNYSKDNIAQQFKLEPVDGEADTYYIKTKNDFCIESQGNSPSVVIGRFHGTDNQKWVFEEFDPANIAQPQGYFAIRCAAGGNFWDFPGTYPDVRSNKLQLWSPGNAIGDRTIEIRNKDGYYTMRPDHHPSNLITAKKNEQLTTAGNKYGDDQLFIFEYGFEPNAYIIINKGTRQVIDADAKQTNATGCRVSDARRTNEKNQRWILYPVGRQTPVYEGMYFVKCEGSNKYWDLSGNDSESNKNGARAQIWDLDGGRDRMIKFIPADEEGYYFIQFNNGDRLLDVSGPWNITSMSLTDQAKYRAGAGNIKLKKDRGAKLQAYEKTGNDAQKFKLVYQGNGVFCVISKIEGRAVDVSGAKINENGPDLQLWDANSNNPGQRFVFISTGNRAPYKY